MASPLDEFRDLLGRLPGPNLESRARTEAREAGLVKPEGALGRLEELTGWYAGWSHRQELTLLRPRTAVFAGNHGIASHGVSAYPAEVTAQMVAGFQAGGAAVNQLCRWADSELRIYELALDKPTADFTKGPAMSEQECAEAMAYGMMAVEDGLDLLCVGEMGIANTTSTAALGLALFGGTAEDWVGPGTGVEGEAFARKIKVVSQGVACHQGDGLDGFDWLARLGGRETAAMVGAIIAARMARMPVILDGYSATMAGAMVAVMKPGALDHCQIGHCSAEPAHRMLAERIGKRPLLDFDMRLGEASGAVLALGILRAALACHTGMASFTEAGVSTKTGSLSSSRPNPE